MATDKKSKVLTEADRLVGHHVTLRLVTLEDCTPRYRAWLADPEVNQYLETRWEEQTLEAIRDFVQRMHASPDNYLFAIVERAIDTHVGNIKLGPIDWHHRCADVSYFVGERERWGRGLATDAIRVVTRFGFARLGLHKIRAGLYSSNVASARALERAGYRREASLRSQLLGRSGWEDHLWYGILQDEMGTDQESLSDAGVRSWRS